MPFSVTLQFLARLLLCSLCQFYSLSAICTPSLKSAASVLPTHTVCILYSYSAVCISFTLSLNSVYPQFAVYNLPPVCTLQQQFTVCISFTLSMHSVPLLCSLCQFYTQSAQHGEKKINANIVVKRQQKKGQTQKDLVPSCGQ